MDDTSKIAHKTLAPLIVQRAGVVASKLCRACLPTALCVVLAWIWSNAFTGEFHSDTADTILWADAFCKDGALFSPTFQYGYFIPFAGNLLYYPMIKIFGFGMCAVKAGMSAFACLFALALWGLFRSMKWSKAGASFASGIVLMTLCASMKLREIFFGHIIHYSLIAVFLFACFSLLAETPAFGRGVTTRSKLRFLSYCLLIFWASSCELNVLMLVPGTIIVAILAFHFFEERPLVQFERQDLQTILATFASAVAGLFVYKLCESGVALSRYNDKYEVFSRPESWGEQLQSLPFSFINLIADVTPDCKILSIQGIIGSVGVCAAVCAGLAPVIAFFFYSSFNKKEKMFLWAHWFAACAVIYYWVFGTISNVNWRLGNVVATSLVVSLMLMRNIWTHSKSLVQRRIVCIFGALLVLASIVFGVGAFVNGFGEKVWFANDALIAKLKAKGVHKAYCTDFWFSNAVTVVTDGDIVVREVICPKSKGIWTHRKYQNDDKWYAKSADLKRTALVCMPGQAKMAPENGLISKFECDQYDVRNRKSKHLSVLVYEGDVPFVQ